MIFKKNRLLCSVLRNEKTYQYLQLFSLLLIPWGLFFFEALPSILVITFAFPLLFFTHIIQVRKMISYSWPYFLIYAILVVTGFWSGDTERWLNLLRINLPYIVLPLAFFLWPGFLISYRRSFQQQFVWAGAVLSLYLIIYVMWDMNEILQMIREGGSFPLPVHHVRTSLFLAIACLFTWDELARRLWLSKGYLLYGGLLVLLVFGIHLLAVRTGLLLFYGGTLLIFLFNRNFHGQKGISSGVVLGILIVLIFFLAPTIHEKWIYFLEDIRNYDSHSWWFYSDAVRWKSNVLGWEITRGAPWWGVGMGDVFQHMHMQFYEKNNIRIWEYPHNLWITFLAGSGLVGFMLLNLSLGKLFQLIRNQSSVTFLIIYIIYMVSCLFENTLLTSLGCISITITMLIATGTCGNGHKTSDPE